MNRFGLPDLGIGIGLRTVHFGEILTRWPDVDWFEVLSENYMDSGGRPAWVLDQVCERYPSVGSSSSRIDLLQVADAPPAGGGH